VTLDRKRTLAAYRARRGAFDVVEVPPLTYLTVDGHGDPNTSASYAEALAVLYPVAYALRFAGRARGHDETVMPLEALWWSDEMTAFTSARDKSRWSWTALILAPTWVDGTDVAEAVATVARRKPGLGGLERLDLRPLDEGLCMQTLHVGPYVDEGPVLARMHDVEIPARGLRMTGRHHEIYLGDPRRTAPERLRTILRQPVERVDG
jgi:hypothetical protein